MTQRLYYLDPYKREFDASIVRVDRDGPRTTVRLDQTAWYPTSGGQPFDTGTLSSGSSRLQVVDVFEDEEGDVVHLLDESGSTAKLQLGDRVSGVVDWQRRFDHMQQHTGQHLLSAALDRLFGALTVSFHLGNEICTIDLSREMTAKEIAAAEAEANRIVWEDRPVAIRFVEPGEAATLPLRKEPARQGTLRVIDIEGFDLSACGGTHVARTGAVGIIAATGWERFKGGQRLEFVCGSRTLARFQSFRDALAGAVRRLSVLPGELGPAIDRLQGDFKEVKRDCVSLKSELADYRARDMFDTAAEPIASGLAVIQVVPGDMASLKMLAVKLTSQPGRIAVLVSRETPSVVVVAAAPDTGIAADKLLGALLKRFGGRGGGKADLAQGGGLTASPEILVTEARNVISGGSAGRSSAELGNTEL